MSAMDDQKELLIITNYIEMGRYQHAVDRLLGALEQRPSDGHLVYLYAFCQYCLDRYEEAFDACKTALTGGFRPDTCYYLLSKILLQMDRYQEAEANLLTALDIDPENAEFLAFYGYLHMLLGNNHQALELINQALELDPGSLSALHYKFYYYLGMDDTYGLRSKVMDTYFSLSTNESDRFLKAGMLDYYDFDYQGAEENLRQAFQLDPTNKYILKLLDEINRKPRIYHRWKRVIRRRVLGKLAVARAVLNMKWVLFKGVGLTWETSLLFTVPLALVVMIVAGLILILHGVPLWTK
ncbi:Tetratricopeptide repeat protein [compost metagenome]